MYYKLYENHVSTLCDRIPQCTLYADTKPNTSHNYYYSSWVGYMLSQE